MILSLKTGKKKNPFGSTSSIQRNLPRNQTLSALGGQRGLCVVFSSCSLWSKEGEEITRNSHSHSVFAPSLNGPFIQNS
ncbi:hypothetical protein AKJ16_DCAP20413 [Drosera capensis]